MKARMLITVEGKLALFVDEGTYADGVTVAAKLMKELGDDLQIDIQVAPPEQHRHGPGFEHQHAGQHTHADGVSHAH